MSTHAFQQYGRTFSIEANDPVLEKEYAAGRFYEGQMIDWILANVPHGGIWVDCGANVGNHALAFATAAHMVVAIEPIVVNYDMLERNIKMSGCGNVLPLRVGVGQGPKLMDFHPTAQGRPSQFGLYEGPSPCVAVMSLDNIIPGANARLLKIDVEGMEYETLLGARNIIHNHKPEIFVEIWDAKELDVITAWLALSGYILIERWNEAPTYHFSASGRYPVTYKLPVE